MANNVTNNYPLGTIVQIAQVVKTDTFSTASVTPVDITGLSINIIPTNINSKIWILAQISLEAASETAAGILARNGTNIFYGTTGGGAIQSTVYSRINNSEGLYPCLVSFIISYFDSPGTTSSVNYKIQLFSPSGVTACVNTTPSDSAGYPRVTSTLTVMDFA